MASLPSNTRLQWNLQGKKCVYLWCTVQYLQIARFYRDTLYFKIATIEKLIRIKKNAFLHNLKKILVQGKKRLTRLYKRKYFSLKLIVWFQKALKLFNKHRNKRYFSFFCIFLHESIIVSKSWKDRFFSLMYFFLATVFSFAVVCVAAAVFSVASFVFFCAVAAAACGPSPTERSRPDQSPHSAAPHLKTEYSMFN